MKPTNRTPANDLIWNEDLIKRYDLSGPRYTSYPTAPQFNQNFTQQDWEQAATSSNESGKPVSIYVHIPFCDTVCYYCGCNKVITKNKARAVPYLQGLHREIEHQSRFVDKTREVTQLHFGGGTPTYISDEQLTALIHHISKHFNLLSGDKGEYSIEIHPQTVTPARLGLLRGLGFNRLSLGIQDFNPAVQQAVNRFNTFDEVEKLTSSARDLGFKSISYDLIYGLPKQTMATFKETLEQVIQLKPDRLSLFNYAHMPHLFKVQKQINVIDLPNAADKLDILHHCINRLCAAGYVYIGMDHFALPDDELAIAQKHKNLHRNFQGYATKADCDLFSFGVSAISHVNNTFAQNRKDIESYLADLDQNHLPITRGFALNRDDLIRKDVIMALICQFELRFAEIEKAWQINFLDYFADAINNLQSMQADGLLSMDNEGIEVLEPGRLLIRRICMEFDKYLQHQTLQVSESPVKYSRII